MKARSGINRRQFLTGTLRGRNVAMAATGAIAWTHVVSESRGAEGQLRPPGARDEADFIGACIKCGQCVEACPFDTLRLATLGEEQAVGVPTFEPREAPCHMCEDVPCIAACPTDALVKETAIEDARMGLAVLLDHESCLAYQGLRCEVCYRSCPVMGKAISLQFQSRMDTGGHVYFIPKVNSNACTGCGKCERACILQEPAIRVLPREIAKAELGDHYRFEWQGSDPVQDVTKPAAPAWDESLERVIEKMDDLSGITEP